MSASGLTTKRSISGKSERRAYIKGARASRLAGYRNWIALYGDRLTYAQWHHNHMRKPIMVEPS